MKVGDNLKNEIIIIILLMHFDLIYKLLMMIKDQNFQHSF